MHVQFSSGLFLITFIYRLVLLNQPRNLYNLLVPPRVPCGLPHFIERLTDYLQEEIRLIWLNYAPGEPCFRVMLVFFTNIFYFNYYLHYFISFIYIIQNYSKMLFCSKTVLKMDSSHFLKFERIYFRIH